MINFVVHLKEDDRFEYYEKRLHELKRLGTQRAAIMEGLV